jgi:hypothetical protein
LKFTSKTLWIAAAVLTLTAGATLAASQAAPPTAQKKKTATHLVLPPAPKALLPEALSGWTAPKPAEKLTDAAQVDSTNTAALKEYGFTDAELAEYKRGGETMSLRAVRFQDASGAFGAYSLYRQNGWPKEQIGSGATSNKNRVLFWVGNILVEANFSHIGPMSAAELRELAAKLPQPGENKAMAPPILLDLPQAALDPRTTHYAEGPAGYTGAGGVLPPELVGFDKGAEAVTANYSLRSGVATLTIVDYPTPQMAQAQEARIRAYVKAGKQAQPAWPKPLQDSDLASLEVRRSGPLVILVSGDAIPEESHKLIESVYYSSSVTTIPVSHSDEVRKTGQLLFGIAELIGIGSLTAIILGLSFGWFRVLWRVAHGKPASSVYETEFIRLNLRD